LRSAVLPWQWSSRCRMVSLCPGCAVHFFPGAISSSPCVTCVCAAREEQNQGWGLIINRVLPPSDERTRIKRENPRTPEDRATRSSAGPCGLRFLLCGEKLRAVKARAPNPARHLRAAISADADRKTGGPRCPLPKDYDGMLPRSLLVNHGRSTSRRH